MADFMTSVKAAHSQARDEGLLTEVTSRPTEQRHFPAKETTTPARRVSSPGDVLELLLAQPSTDELLRALTLLSSHSESFNIESPGPLQAQIINALVTSIVPNFWSVLEEKDRHKLVTCLRSLAGCSAVATRIRTLASNLRSNKVNGAAQELQYLHSMANFLFDRDDFCFQIYFSLNPSFKNYGKAQMGWKEFVSLVSSGKIISALAQAEDVLKATGQTIDASWLASGTKYANWLGRNASAFLAKCVDGRQPVGGTIGAATDLLAKGPNLGYPMPFVSGFITALIRDPKYAENGSKVLGGVIKALPTFAARQLLETLLRWLSTLRATTQSVSFQEQSEQAGEVSASAAVLNLMVNPYESMQKQLLIFIGDPVLFASISFTVRRACVAVLAPKGSDELQSLLEQLIKTFADPLFINHAPMLQQEALAQSILLTAGALHRATPMAVFMTARSSNYMQGVSNRLDSSNSKARWLGMVVSTAFSSLVDEEGSKMNFGTDDMQTGEARWYLQLVSVEDTIGTVGDFDRALKSRDGTLTQKRQTADETKTVELPIINGKRVFGPERPPAQTEVIGEKVSEVLDEDGDDDDDGLRPHGKPDSDPEDSDEDATLVNRNKARPPVYVRDLMRMLKDDKDHDRFQMGIKHASTLIRRKTTFGREVKDHAEELALILCDLQDPFETEEFDELKLQALIAVLLSHVDTLAPWLSRQSFGGDYSLSQRCIMLSALGLGGRELAGFKQDELNPAPPTSSIDFASKRLGAHLHATYSPTDASTRRLEAASQTASHQLIKPLALSAADETTSYLDAVKVKTFSSRMNVERTKRRPQANQLAKIFASAFFTPLVGCFQQEMATYGERSVFASSFVLVTFIKTLAILLHAAGPAVLELGEITTVFWDLLLSFRIKAINDISVLEAVLFGLLTLFEVNDGSKQRLAQDNPKQLVETQQWVELVFDRTGGSELVSEGKDEETRVRTLAAGVLVKAKEIIEGYQRLLIGYT